VAKLQAQALKIRSGNALNINIPMPLRSQLHFIFETAFFIPSKFLITLTLGRIEACKSGKYVENVS
jgi:hypothetical protein